jgi:citrate synthase
MTEYATLHYAGKEFRLPLVEGSAGEKAIDISRLRQDTGLITLDSGFANTGSCRSAITFVDGERGILRYRGIPVEQLAERSTFKETAYLLINGALPSQKELTQFSVLLNDHSLVHEDMKIFYQNFPRSSHPMGILSAMVNALRSFYPELQNLEEEINMTVTRLLSKERTMANMMFASPVRPYELDPDVVKALNVFLILHADHEQNCSTAAVRVVGSARVNLYAAISAGIAALWGPLHGGANQAVIEMLEDIARNKNLNQAVARAKDRKDTFRLMGFGHRVYKTYDPRAKIMKRMVHTLLDKLRLSDPLLDVAMELEEIALRDDYFVEHHLYPNVDFYSGIALRAIGIPTNMFTVMFAIGRLPGWIAQWKESMDDPDWKLCRPRQVYVGPVERPYVSMEER